MVAHNGQSQPDHAERTSPDDYAIDGLPELTAEGNRFVSAYIRSGFKLAAATKAANISPSQAHRFTASASVHEHLDAHFRFLHGAHKCRAVEARDFLIEEIIKLLPQVTDTHEKRLLLQQLHRATSAPIAPAPRAISTPRWDDEEEEPSAPSPDDSQSYTQPDRKEGRPSLDDEEDSPTSAPASMPSSSAAASSNSESLKSEISNSSIANLSDRTVFQSNIDDPEDSDDEEDEDDNPLPVVEHTDLPHQIAPKVLAALKSPDQLWPGGDMAIIADVIEYNAEIDGEPVGSDDEQEIVEALDDTSLIPLRSHIAADHLESTSHSDRPDRQATEIWLVQTKAGPVKVTIDFTRTLNTDPDSLSRFPGRWMITKITTSPDVISEQGKEGGSG